MICKRNIIFLALMLCASFSLFPAESVKQQLESLYRPSKLADHPKKTILVCLSDKIPATVLPLNDGPWALLATVGHNVTLEIDNGAIAKSKGEIHSYLKKGELLFIGYRKVSGDRIRLNLFTLAPHMVTRGVGAMAHDTPEMLGLDVRFKFPPSLLQGNDVTPIQSEIEKWFKSFQDYDSALAFGNTQAGVFVQEIKIGMTQEEVERTLGIPERKFTFPDKLVYKYKDFTVEFTGNVVTDIKY